MEMKHLLFTYKIMEVMWSCINESIRKTQKVSKCVWKCVRVVNAVIHHEQPIQCNIASFPHFIRMKLPLELYSPISFCLGRQFMDRNFSSFGCVGILYLFWMLKGNERSYGWGEIEIGGRLVIVEVSVPLLWITWIFGLKDTAHTI